MHLARDFPLSGDPPPLPRAQGRLRLSSKQRDGQSCLDALHSAGCARVVFPRRTDAVEAIIVNTSGGLTGGDRFEIEATAGPDSGMILTTQAAERAYRSTGDIARVRTHLSVQSGASLRWLPQELLVFDGAALDRRLEVDLGGDTAEFLMVEPVIFGRTAMQEVVQSATLLDRVRIRRAGRPLYEDRVALSGDIPKRLSQAATLGGMQAMASVVYVGPRAEALLKAARILLPATGGGSLVRADTLVIRLLATDGFALRTALCPLLESLGDAPLPRSWRL